MSAFRILVLDTDYKHKMTPEGKNWLSRCRTIRKRPSYAILAPLPPASESQSLTPPLSPANVPSGAPVSDGGAPADGTLDIGLRGPECPHRFGGSGDSSAKAGQPRLGAVTMTLTMN